MSKTSKKGEYTFGTLNLTMKKIQKFVEIWDTMSNKDLAEYFGWSPDQVSYVAYRIRQAGHVLPKKRTRNVWDLLIKEALGLPLTGKGKK